MQINGLLKEAQEHVREVSPTSIVGVLANYLVLDVREPHEVLYGFLPGAINVPRGTIEFRVTDDTRLADQARAILVYSGDGKRSVLAALTLTQLGYSDVQSLAGGIERWSQESLPVE